MTIPPNNDLLSYTFKKNHLKIYSEFLNFQPLDLPKADTSVRENIPKSFIENESRLNIRNFNALYWITLYLKNIKQNPLSLIYDFFIFKKWTTWSYKNFSYHYYKICKQPKSQNEIFQMQRLISAEEQIEIPEAQITAPQGIKHQPKILGDNQSKQNKPIIDMYASTDDLMKSINDKKARFGN